MNQKLIELREEDSNELENLCKIITHGGNENLSLNVYKSFAEKMAKLKEKNYDVSSYGAEAVGEISRIKRYQALNK